MTVASLLMIEKGTLRITHELLIAKVHEVELGPDHAALSVEELSQAAEEHDARSPPREQTAPSWLVVEFESDMTEFTRTRVEDGSWRYRLQLAKGDTKARARFVRQVLRRSLLKIVLGDGDCCRCEWC